MIELSGVRSSWLVTARNFVLGAVHFLELPVEPFHLVERNVRSSFLRRNSSWPAMSVAFSSAILRSCRSRR